MIWIKAHASFDTSHICYHCAITLLPPACVCSGGGAGLPHLHPIILPLVPCPFQGVPQSQMGGGTPVQDGYPLARSGWGTPQDRMGKPLASLRLDRLCCGRYASCGFPQEDFLVVVIRFSAFSSLSGSTCDCLSFKNTRLHFVPILKILLSFIYFLRYICSAIANYSVYLC